MRKNFFYKMIATLCGVGYLPYNRFITAAFGLISARTLAQTLSFNLYLTLYIVFLCITVHIINKLHNTLNENNLVIDTFIAMFLPFTCNIFLKSNFFYILLFIFTFFIHTKILIKVNKSSAISMILDDTFAIIYTMITVFLLTF